MLRRLREAIVIDYGNNKMQQIYLHGTIKGVDYIMNFHYQRPNVKIELGIVEGDVIKFVHTEDSYYGGSIHQSLSAMFSYLKIKVPRDANTSSGLDLNNLINSLVSKYKFKEKK